MADNPFTRVYNKVWDILEASSDFTAIFPVGNRVKFNSDTLRSPLKEKITSADVPEIMVHMPNMNINLNNSSNTTKIVTKLQIVVNTGDYRINLFLNNIQWLLLCILKDAESEICTLTWRGDSFCKILRINDIAIGDRIENRDSGVNGFTSLWACELEMHFAHSDIVFEES